MSWLSQREKGSTGGREKKREKNDRLLPRSSPRGKLIVASVQKKGGGRLRTRWGRKGDCISILSRKKGAELQELGKGEEELAPYLRTEKEPSHRKDARTEEGLSRPKNRRRRSEKKRKGLPYFLKRRPVARKKRRATTGWEKELPSSPTLGGRREI